VSGTTRDRDVWRVPAFILWIFFFLIGLAPEEVYFWLREVAGVLPQRALVNSYHLITLGLAGYLGLFCYHRCLDAGLSPREAQDRGLQLTVVGLVAFLSFDFRLLVTAHMNSIFQYRLTTYFVGISKLVAWWALMALFIRYYAFREDRVFAGIPSLFPSTHRRSKNEASTSPTQEETLGASGSASDGNAREHVQE
jgi:hypothetical protein